MGALTKEKGLTLEAGPGPGSCSDVERWSESAAIAARPGFNSSSKRRAAQRRLPHHQTRSRGLSHHGTSCFLLLQIFQKVQNLEQILGRLDVDAVNEARSMSRSSMR